MGRTNPTFRNQVEGTIDQLENYRRTLIRRDQQHFDTIVDDMRQTADAGGVANLSDPWAAMLFGVCIMQQRRISNLET